MSIVFTVDGESGYRGFSSITVTYMVEADDDDDEVYYDKYLTACGDIPEPEEALEPLTANPSPLTVKKILIDGHLYIVIDNVVYNITGQRIR